MSWVLSLVVAGTVARGPATGAIDRPSLVHPRPAEAVTELLAGESRRIRSSDRRIVKLLSEGARRSKTFADLIVRIHQTDLILYVETTHDMGGDTIGRTLFQGMAGGQRYLRVQVRAFLQGDYIIAVLGHEFHHALEVADDGSVIDEPSLTALYRRIGQAGQSGHSFETTGARLTGIRVRDELIG